MQGIINFPLCSKKVNTVGLMLLLRRACVWSCPWPIFGSYAFGKSHMFSKLIYVSGHGTLLSQDNWTICDKYLFSLWKSVILKIMTQVENAFVASPL